MAYVVKSAGASYPVYSYPQLAELHQRAAAGDAVASIKLNELPAAERRLAGHLVDVFGGHLPAGKPPAYAFKGTDGPDGYCLKCGAEMKKTHRRCKKCRAANRFYVGGVRPVKKKKARRAQFTGKSYSYGAARPVSRQAALKDMLRQDLASPDPALRETARKALEAL